jgi:lysophospholipase L1-like esterase
MLQFASGGCALTRTIVCFGDSNSYGTPGLPDPTVWGRFAPHERWPGVMAARLGAGWTIIEEGLPGRTTVHDDPIEGVYKNGLRSLPVVLESHRPIDVLILMLGSNDLKARFSVTPEDIAASVGVLASMVLASEAGPDGRAPQLLVIAPPVIAEAGYMAGPFRGGAEKSTHFSRCFADMAGRLGIDLLDAAPLITSDPADGIHLARDQHVILGQAIAEKMKQGLTRKAG